MNKRINSLDLLKLCLSIIIVFHHYQMKLGVSFSFVNFSGGVFYIGYLVEAFFMISGYLSSYKIKKIDGVSFKDYILNKLISFYPSVFISVVATYVLVILSYFLLGYSIDTKGIGIWRFVSSCFLIFHGEHQTAGYGLNEPLWYLSVLIICYALFYCCCWLSKKTRTKLTYIFVLLIGFGTYLHTYPSYNPFIVNLSRGIVSFNVGALLFYIYEKINGKKAFIISSMILLLLVIMGFVSYYTFFDSQWEVFVFLAWPCLLMWFLYIDKYIKKNHINENLSYLIYVWHTPLISVLLILKEMMDIDKLLYEEYSLYSMLIFTLFVVVFSFVMIKPNTALKNYFVQLKKKIENNN